MRDKTDLELVEEFKNDNIAGFNELVRRYQERVYWIARRIVVNHDEADDVVQEVFLKVYRSLKNFRGESNFFTWLYRIVTNTSLNALRKRRIKDFLHYDDLKHELISKESNIDDIIGYQEYKTVLEKAIEKLPPKQRLIFNMRYYEEIPYQEISKLLKKSVGGLKASYFFALKKIQDYIRKELENEV